MKLKIFYCTCHDPTCNVTVYEFDAIDNNSNVVITAPIYSKIDYPIKLYRYDILVLLTYPFKFIYNLIQYLTKPMQAEYNFILTVPDENKVNKIFTKYGLAELNTKFDINKSYLCFMQKLEYILFGEIELNLNAEYYLNELDVRYK